MSYETFHKIKHLENGDFLVTTKCSNDSAPPHEWIMDYYRKSFPTFNNKQREAAFILSGLYSGNVYYPERYKRLQQLANEYSRKVFENTGDYPYPIYGGLSEVGYERDKKWYGENSIRKPEHLTLFSTYEEYKKSVDDSNFKAVNGFVEYVDSQEIEPKIKGKIRLSDGSWISRLATNSRRIAVCELENDAQIFKKPLSEINKLMERISKRYGAELIIIEECI